MSGRKPIGILISGRGSNMGALIDACRDEDFPARVAVVISNRPEAAGLARAAADGIATAVVDHRQYPSREDFERALDACLREHGAEMVCNAGFMRLLTAWFVERWRDRHLNIHPSLLPAYRGLHTHERVLQDGGLITGCTVHFVRTEMDAGPIVAQAAVPVVAGDTADGLADRVLAAEHRLYPAALALVAAGKVSVDGECIVVTDIDCADWATGALYSPPLA